MTPNEWAEKVTLGIRYLVEIVVRDAVQAETARCIRVVDSFADRQWVDPKEIVAALREGGK